MQSQQTGGEVFIRSGLILKQSTGYYATIIMCLTAAFRIFACMMSVESLAGARCFRLWDFVVAKMKRAYRFVFGG